MLRTVNFNETRVGLNKELKGLKKEEKHKLFRSLASNLPLEWCKKFDAEEFKPYRLEYTEDLDLEEEDFNKLDAEPYLNKTKCSGNYRMLVCLSSNKNDAKNSAIKEDSFAKKSQQCEHCYWYHTAVNVLVDGPSLEESPLLI